MPLYGRRWVASTEGHEELYSCTSLDLLDHLTLRTRRVFSKHESWRMRMPISSMSDVLTRTLENPQFGARMVWSTIRISLLLVAHCSHFLYRDDMSNSRYIVHIGSYIFRMQPLHHWLCGILEQFHLVCAITKKFGQGSWNPHIWVHFQANTVATLVTGLPLDTHRSSGMRLISIRLFHPGWRVLDLL